ncbi:DUF2637 domain-containing protein [Nocardia higoensis]|uniref:DUF2637 domain-containing protein n=1 Tax=Nocardia higoensis TaxID=228599 RepID=UPI003A5CD2C1
MGPIGHVTDIGFVLTHGVPGPIGEVLLHGAHCSRARRAISRRASSAAARVAAEVLMARWLIAAAVARAAMRAGESGAAGAFAIASARRRSRSARTTARCSSS